MNYAKKFRGIITNYANIYKEAIECSKRCGGPVYVAFIDTAAMELQSILAELEKSDAVPDSDLNDLINLFIYHLSIFTALHVNECKGEALGGVA